MASTKENKPKDEKKVIIIFSHWTKLTAAYGDQRVNVGIILREYLIMKRTVAKRVYNRLLYNETVVNH